MISSLGQDASVPIYSYNDAVGNQQRQLTIDALHAMMEQDITHTCRDYLNDGDCISEDEVLTSDDHVSESSQKLTVEDRAQIVDWCYSLIDLCQPDRMWQWP